MPTQHAHRNKHRGACRAGSGPQLRNRPSSEQSDRGPKHPRMWTTSKPDELAPTCVSSTRAWSVRRRGAEARLQSVVSACLPLYLQ